MVEVVVACFWVCHWWWWSLVDGGGFWVCCWWWILGLLLVVVELGLDVAGFGCIGYSAFYGFSNWRI